MDHAKRKVYETTFKSSYFKVIIIIILSGTHTCMEKIVSLDNYGIKIFYLVYS